MAADWKGLPLEILQALGVYLDASGWAAARCTCKAWKSITADIQLLEIDLERDAHRWMMVLTCVSRIFPRLSSIVLLVGSRITPAIFAERLAALAITGIKLQELEVRFIYVSNPLLGAALSDLSGVTELRQLKVLRLAGGSTPPPEFFPSLSHLRHLSVLEVLPGAFGSSDWNTSGSAGDAVTSEVGLYDAHLSALASLTQLKQMTLKVCPMDTSADGFVGLAATPALAANLEHLALYDSELPAASLAPALGSASKLTSLQIGLNSVENLQVLARLPKLKDLSLDTAFLPDLRELVVAAAQANIPTSGPGAITGLCLLDQVVQSAPELAALTQLSSLSELVLVNPMSDMPPPGDTADAAAEAATGLEQPPAAAAAAQQQQQPLQIDMTVLSGLPSLQNLQIDLAKAPMQQIIPIPGAQQAAEDNGIWPEQMQVVWRQPLQLKFTAASVAQLAAAWTQLASLDLTGFNASLLPEDAIAGITDFKTLKTLSIVSSGSEGDQTIQLQAGQQQRNAGQVLARKLTLWQLPKRLTSLCLSQFDLSGHSSSASSSSNAASEQGYGGCSNSRKCCLAVSPEGSPPQQQQRVCEAAISWCKPLTPLRKRRRQSQQRTEDPDWQPDSVRGNSGGRTGAGSSSRGRSAASLVDAAGAAGLAPPTSSSPAAAAAAAGGESSPDMQCLCSQRLSTQFSALQSLWLEHVTLPPNFLMICLPLMAVKLEGLALLHVSGTRSQEMRSLSCLTALTGLRLIPTDHALIGLNDLVGLKHLKKLNIKLTHLLPADLTVLPRLRSLFCLSLAAPLSNGQLLPGFPSPVRLQQVLDVVQEKLPYCDVELQPEPKLPAGQ